MDGLECRYTGGGVTSTMISMYNVGVALVGQYNTAKTSSDLVRTVMDDFCEYKR